MKCFQASRIVSRDVEERTTAFQWHDIPCIGDAFTGVMNPTPWNNLPISVV